MTRILIVAGVRIYREGLAHILGRRDLTVVGTASGPGEISAKGRDLGLDVVLIDIATLGSDAVREVQRLLPGVPVMALGVSEAERDIVTYAEAGFAGFATREASAEDLVAAVESAVRGELTCSPRVAGALLRRVGTLATGRGGQEHPQARLTGRERQIVSLMGQDFSNKQIAVRLGIEVATVKNHVHNVLEKLNVHRRAEAARLFSRSLESLSTA